jgi:hypothetical protein
MRLIVLSAFLLASFTACGSETSSPMVRTDTLPAQNRLSKQERKDGWEMLFDGLTTRGWHKYGGKVAGAAWKVEDGQLFLDTTTKENWQIKGGGDIMSDEVFSDFHLKLEWKIARNGNSGIMFYAQEDTTKYRWPWETAPEMQVLDNAGHPDGKIIKHRAGDLYDLISAWPETVRAPGEWNQVEIKSEKGKLEFWLNGVNVVTTSLWDDSWKKMVAASKFARMPDFGKFKKGHIALQDHGDMVWYRNIKIRRL